MKLTLRPLLYTQRYLLPYGTDTQRNQYLRIKVKLWLNSLDNIHIQIDCEETRLHPPLIIRLANINALQPP